MRFRTVSVVRAVTGDESFLGAREQLSTAVFLFVANCRFQMVFEHRSSKLHC